MNTKNNTMFKVATDLFLFQMKWTLWFIPAVLGFYLFLPIVLKEITEVELNFLSTMFNPSKIYMLVIGIISALAFFNHYVQNGITRKDYVSGSAMAATGVAFSIMIIASIINGILHLIEPLTGFSPSNTHIAFLDTTSMWIIPILVFSLIILCYYIAGWMIIAGFQRLGGWGCFVFILIALLYFSLTDLLWQGDISHPLINAIGITDPNLSTPAALFCTLILIAVGLLLIRMLTKSVAIQPK
ncbi:hypothetical protein SAMN04487943_10582 [Gracilibacillus orientalis]|uniref:ABC-2 type transport system permease protein n=1 Tax=Gracilibacillus orientalis TaxID=334253 RepID=A0A1I4LM60_9BACI|nr:hypothetical protein [Gracilibacillus orientalis]SFL91657.1 hypothetical protein SAMN04487943_10582 [Gracilibacillus orientalis]